MKGTAIIFFTIIIFIQANTYSEENYCNNFVLVINPGDPEAGKYLKDWGPLLKKEDIYILGRGRGIHLIDDRGPVADGKAQYVSTFGSKVKISGLKRNCFYRIWIDFVGYKISSNKEIFPSMKLYLSADSETYPVKEVSWMDAGKKLPLFIDIPYELSLSGTVELRFGDYSENNKMWGVWDIIVTAQRDMPQKESILNYLRKKRKGIIKEKRIINGNNF